MTTGSVASAQGLEDALDGLPAGTLVQVYGPPAAGKTSLALTVAARQPPSALVLPEAPLPERIEAILAGSAQRALVARPDDFQAQAQAVQRASDLLAKGQVASLVLDSLTFLYRFEQRSSTDALQALFDQVRRMRQAARASSGIALFTNQVRGTPEGWQALGGPAMAHASDVILSMRLMEGSWRSLHLEKHPTAPSGAAWEVKIGADGLA